MRRSNLRTSNGGYASACIMPLSMRESSTDCYEKRSDIDTDMASYSVESAIICEKLMAICQKEEGKTLSFALYALSLGEEDNDNMLAIPTAYEGLFSHRFIRNIL